jgi:hypothetical protein
MAHGNLVLRSYCDGFLLYMLSQAVLKYLQECLSEAEKGEQQYSSDSTAPQGLSKHTVPLHPIDSRFSLVASTSIILLLVSLYLGPFRDFQ